MIRKVLRSRFGATAGLLKMAEPYVGELPKQGQDFVAAFTKHQRETIATIFGNAARRCWDRAQATSARAHFILLDLGLKPGPVKDDVLLPLLDASSPQDDERLRDLWANMLANAADPRKLHNIISVFITILKDLSVREVVLLSSCGND